MTLQQLIDLFIQNNITFDFGRRFPDGKEGKREWEDYHIIIFYDGFYTFNEAGFRAEAIYRKKRAESFDDFFYSVAKHLELL